MLAVENDSLLIAGLRLALQRISLSHWSAEAVLRGWAVAPIIFTGNRVAAPCILGEAIWMGFWLDGDAKSATISITDKISGMRASKRCPESFQLTVLSNGIPQPICRRPDEPMRAFAIEVAVTGRTGDIFQEQFQLCLLEPQTWANESGRPAPGKLTGPPPLPPRLG
jgi:hypothetical protein